MAQRILLGTGTLDGGVNMLSTDVALRTLETDFDKRWAGWVTRGRVHERRVRVRLTIFLSALSIAVGLLYTFFW
jgi:hypothetical protein